MASEPQSVENERVWGSISNPAVFAVYPVLAAHHICNADCRSEFFGPFSCKAFHLCPSCSQKRTLLFGEYANERLLLQQFPPTPLVVLARFVRLPDCEE
jgi:hypothetical protein